MKKIFIFLAIMHFHFTSTAQDRLEIKLEQVDGIGPFPERFTTTIKKIDQSNPYFHSLPNLLEVPQLQGYTQSFILPNTIQFFHQSVKAGTLDSSYWEMIEERYTSPELIENISPTAIQSYIRLASKKNNDGSFDLWVDLNGDHSTDSLEFYHFEADKVHLSKERKREGLPVIRPQYETSKNGKVQTTSLPVKLDPYDKENEVMFTIYSHRKGILNTGNENVEIFASNGFIVDFFYKQTLDLIADDKPPVGIEDLLLAGNKEFVIIDIDRAGSLLTLEPKNFSQIKRTGTFVGAIAPSIQSTTIHGEPFESNNQKLTLLDFWGTWCGPCIAEIPFLKDVASFFDQEEFEIVGIAMDNQSKLKYYVAKNDVFWPQVMYSYGKGTTDLTKIFNVTAFPTTYLIDPKHEIVEKNEGLRGYGLYRTISRHLGKNPQAFIDFIAQGEAVISLKHKESTLQSAYITGKLNEKKYFYPTSNSQHFIRGIQWPEHENSLTFEIVYTTKEGESSKKEITVSKAELVEGKFEIIL